MTGPWFLDYEHEEEIAVLLKRYGQSLEQRGILLSYLGRDVSPKATTCSMFYFPSSSCQNVKSKYVPEIYLLN